VPWSDNDTKEVSAKMNKSRGAVLITPVDGGPSFLHCNSLGEFNNTISNDKCVGQNMTAKEVNKTLNLNLGLKINPMNKTLRRICNFLSDFFSLFEEYLFQAWDSLSLGYRQKVAFFFSVIPCRIFALSQVLYRPFTDALFLW